MTDNVFANTLKMNEDQSQTTGVNLYTKTSATKYAVQCARSFMI